MLHAQVIEVPKPTITEDVSAAYHIILRDHMSILQECIVTHAGSQHDVGCSYGVLKAWCVHYLQEDVILKVTSTAICGSDLHLYLNFMPGMKAGDILGHEVNAQHESGTRVSQ